MIIFVSKIGLEIPMKLKAAHIFIEKGVWRSRVRTLRIQTYKNVFFPFVMKLKVKRYPTARIPFELKKSLLIFIIV